MTEREDVIAAARAALAEGELAAEMGWRVSWREVSALHDVIRRLVRELEHHA